MEGRERERYINEEREMEKREQDRVFGTQNIGTGIPIVTSTYFIKFRCLFVSASFPTIPTVVRVR